ncbi:MAG: ABC transporter ATP-binding protein [Methylobacter sp.]|nr:ABC transporter ATP-binding protein [Methylobacter sp.]
MKPIESPQKTAAPSANAAAISIKNLSKCYQLYEQPHDRLKQFLSRGRKQYFREFWALRDVSFEVGKGEVLGIIGRNGSGKSTLLQLICGTLTPTSGDVVVHGRIAALLELGAGFNPEFSGRENVFMSAAIMGLSRKEIDARFEDIVEFSGIRDFIDQPVKTYSSGMYVRLAFSVATSIDPDILVIDEALSVGDGAFARKSFDRILDLKARGTTILFCSHNIYQLEALCQRALWLDNGQMRILDEAAIVCRGYNQFLDQVDNPQPSAASDAIDFTLSTAPSSAGSAQLTHVVATADGQALPTLKLTSMASTLAVHVSFNSSPDLPCPSVAIIITNESGQNITSCCTYYEKVSLVRDAQGAATVHVKFPNIQLLRGHYVVNVFLLCEQAIHIYDSARCSEFEVTQPGLEIGVIALQRTWGQL